MPAPTPSAPDWLAALDHPESKTRLAAALAAGTSPDPVGIPTLVARCAVETEHGIREMLTWALVRHPAELVLPALAPELDSAVPQARSQALHTLSKIRGEGTYAWIDSALRSDPDDEVARVAWRASVVLAPAEAWPALARELVAQLGRGPFDVQRSLSRALAELAAWCDDVRPLLAEEQQGTDARRALHATATLRLADDPDSTFALSLV